MLNDGFDTNDLAIQQAIRQMTDRLDFKAIALSKKIPSNYKQAYVKHLSPIKRFIMRAIR